MLNESLLHTIAEELATAERTAKPSKPISERFPEVGVEDAYDVQRINANRHIAQGRYLVGYKVGLTSRSAQKHFNVFEPDFGHLFGDMAWRDEGEEDLTPLIQPRIEAEIAFVLGRDLHGPGITAAQAFQAVDAVVGAMEIIDSRLADWKIKAADTIADNGSSARYVLGSRFVSPRDLNLTDIGMSLSKNGEVWQTGAGSAVMGSPWNALVFLANTLGERGTDLKAGQIVLSGALAGVLPMKGGDHFTAEFLKLGRVSVRARRN